MTDRPKVQIVRPDDETVNVYVGGKEVASGNHDLHGFSGMGAIEDTARAVARALGADVEDADEPDRQRYTYYVAYDWTGDGVQGVGYCWLDRSGAIEGDADTDDIVARIRRNSPEMKSIMITNFICTDGPF